MSKVDDDELECGHETLSKLVLWHICTDPCAAECRRNKRCAGSRERCIERLFPTPDPTYLRWQVGSVLLLGCHSDWSAEFAANVTEGELEQTGKRIPRGQSRKVAAIVDAYWHACRMRS